MKKLSLFLVIVLTAGLLPAQVDSLAVQSALDGAYQVGEILNGGKAFIPGLPNITLHGLVVGLIFGAIRKWELLKLRKKGKLKE